MNALFTEMDDDPQFRRARHAASARVRRRAILVDVGSMGIVLLAMGVGGVIAEVAADKPVPAERVFGKSVHPVSRVVGAVAAGGLAGFLTMTVYVFKWGAYSDASDLGLRVWLAAVFGAVLAGPFGASEGLPRVDFDGPDVYYGSLIAGVAAVLVIGLVKAMRSSKQHSADESL